MTPINNINRPKKKSWIRINVVKPGSVIFPNKYNKKYNKSKIKLSKNIKVPIRKININGVFVKDVTADIAISK